MRELDDLAAKFVNEGLDLVMLMTCNFQLKGKAARFKSPFNSLICGTVEDGKKEN